MKKGIFLVVILFLGSLMVFAQPEDDKSEMERERQAIQKEIADLQKAYNQLKGQKKVSLGQANVLRRKIAMQERLLSNINKELRIINDDIYLATLEIIRSQKELDTLKSQYARSVVYAYKNRSTYDFLNFLFSAGSFNDAMKRVTYLKTYRSYREQQVNSIKEKQAMLAQRKKDQIAKKEQKNLALQNQSKQVRVLEDQKKEADVVVTQIKSQEKEIQKELSQKKRRDNDLKNAILAIVRREAEKAKEIARKNALATAKTTPADENVASTTKTVTRTTKPVSYLDLNAADVKLNASFSNNKGKLPWPVDNGVVSIRFGSYTIPGTKLKGDNPGLTIATPSSGSAVKSVFDGEVTGVYNMGDGMAVTIRHGKYFTTYNNLTGVTVSKGSSVSTGQSIGRVGQAEEGNGGQIDFILMIETKNVNPEPWLR